MNINQLASRRTLSMLMLCIGLVQIAGYYLAGTLASPDGSMAVPQPDTLLYCQAARRIAEGHPFSFSEGADVCTGTTSVLYPFILAIPYLLGAKGDSLLTAGFLLNALFYLAFLLGWARALQIWLERPLSRLVAGMLIALSGQIAFCAMAQSDIGCWLALSGWLAAGLAMRNRWLYGSLLVLGPWIRPEGMICVVALGLVLAFYALYTRIRSRSLDNESLKGPLAIFLLGIASCGGVFALNYFLTGHAQFASVANKGYFKTLPFAAAADKAALDVLRMLKDYLFGLAASSPRDMFLIPLLSAIFMWIGILRYPWRQKGLSGFMLLLLAGAGGFLSVAQSGWQGTNFDRYLAWIAPMFLVFLAEGIAAVTGYCKGRSAIPALPAAVCLAFSLCTAGVAVFRFNRSSANSNLLRLFAKEIDAQLPVTASIGAFGGSGIVYDLGKRPYRHLWGIYSQEFFVKTEASALEILKNEPEKRFDYWFLTPDQTAMAFGANMKSCCGENILTGPDGMEIRGTSWDAFDRARRPQAAVPSGKRLVCRVDVGYEADEKATDYETIDRYGRPAADPFTIVDTLNGKAAIDAARLLVGGDAMTLSLKPGQDATVVMRTHPRHTEKRTDSIGRNSSDYTFANPLRMNISIDGQLSQQVSVSFATNGFSDVTFTIPGAKIQKTPCRLAFLGDHIAAGYWFYQ